MGGADQPVKHRRWDSKVDLEKTVENIGDFTCKFYNKKILFLEPVSDMQGPELRPERLRECGTQCNGCSDSSSQCPVGTDSARPAPAPPHLPKELHPHFLSRETPACSRWLGPWSGHRLLPHGPPCISQRVPPVPPPPPPSSQVLSASLW